MRLTILSDNRTNDPERFRTEHGLSVLLETDDARILLDTGASDVFARNARTLGIDLSDIDCVFLSHGHADHCGGLRTFLELNRKARVIVSPDALDVRFYSLRGGLHGISPEWPLELMEGRTVLAERTLSLPGNIRILAGIPQTHSLPMGNRHLLVERNGLREPDDFRHELALYADGFLFTGCAHNGLENILEACPWPVRTVLGGFHLLDARGEDSYEAEAQLHALGGRLLARYPDAVFLTSHCTGDGAFRTLREVMWDRIRQFSCGMSGPDLLPEP
ncbi:MAG: MBL fold metallo-hydrolase [Bacteroidales bacterium]|nr:MBL fold metallo-hydrolase [Bacteroidales bacterium]